MKSWLQLGSTIRQTESAIIDGQEALMVGTVNPDLRDKYRLQLGQIILTLSGGGVILAIF